MRLANDTDEGSVGLIAQGHGDRGSVPYGKGAPRGAVYPEAGERPTSLGCRSSPVKLRAV